MRNGDSGETRDIQTRNVIFSISNYREYVKKLYVSENYICLNFILVGEIL